MTRINLCRPIWCGLLAACAVLASIPSQAQATPPSGMSVQASAHIVVPGLEEPLIPFGVSSAVETAALRDAIERFSAQSSDDQDFVQRTVALQDFLRRYPDSAWRLSIQTNLGIGYYQAGYFTKAFNAWRDAWDAGKPATTPALKALTDRAVGELARMHARVGQTPQLEKLFAEIGDRPISGSASELVTGAREGLWTFRNDPGISYLCGPMALKAVLQSLHADNEKIQALHKERSGPKGYTFAQVSALASRLGLKHRVIARSPADPVPVPSVINWKVNHFAAIVEERDGRYRIQDPTFGSADLWISKAAINAEGSGYFLVPSQAVQASVWRDVPAKEATKVYGMGFTSVNEPGATKANDVGLNCNGGAGMCVVNAKLSAVSLNLNDTPIGYTPALGPSVKIRFSYNQRESGQPAVFTSFNVSPKWSLNVMSWIQDRPNFPGSSVMRFPGGGGYITYSSPYIYNSSTGEFSPERQGQAVLVRIPATGALTSYELRMSDGSKQVYAKLEGTTGVSRRVFLSSIVDAAGNAVRLNYDNQLRLVSIADAVNRQTVFQYGHPSFPLQVTKIIDPFGRSASMTYDSMGRLAVITDVLGLQSSFAYDAAGLINAMTTPYGTSRFSYGSDSQNTRYLEITDPLNLTERIEFRHSAPGIIHTEATSAVPVGFSGYNQYLGYRNTFHWDKVAYSSLNRSYLTANITHWLHNQQGQTSPIVESTKAPLERRIWLKYINQSTSYREGANDVPIVIARVLDDGVTQATGVLPNVLGLPTLVRDPLGRITTFTYAANNTDVTSVQQQVDGGSATLASLTYNGQRRPLTSRDAAGQTTQYGYNGAGQLTSVTNPLGQTTNLAYDSAGRLVTITNPNGAVQESRTYDSADRVVTRTDSEGYTLAYGYDALDRLTEIRYPDGTTTEYGYNRLDLVSVRDREGRVMTYGYDANRRLIRITDPLNHATSFSYFGNGTLRSITDAKGNTTSWTIDIQGRPIAKRFPDGSVEAYTYEASTSRLKTVRDALGQSRTVTYFNDDLVKSIAYAGAVNATSGVTFAYDAFFPLRTRMTDGLGTTSWTYHGVGVIGALQLASETGPYGANNTVSYDYDALGRVVTRTVAGASESFAYDPLHRLTSVSNGLGIFNLSYLGQTDQLVSRLATSGAVGTRWAYDGNGGDRRLTAITHNSQARSFGFNTSADGLITGVSESGGGSPSKNWAFAYDHALRLISATPSSGTGSSYAYDAADNLVTLNGGNGNRSASINGLNQITSLNGLPYSYDANGNLLDDGVRTYAWDAENRLVGLALKAAPSRSTVFRYDGLGRRLAIIDSTNAGTVETRHLWCGSRICQARDSGNNVVRRYFEEGVTYPQAGTALYYNQDHLGSVRDVSAVQNGVKVGSFDYDAYGDLTKTSGRIAPEFRYAGLFYHGNSGLYLANHRAYDPKSARWTSRDPIAESGGLNLYGYVGGNPLTFVDPSGLLGGEWKPWEWSSSDWSAFGQGFVQGVAASADGMIPFGDPLAALGAYDACDATLQQAQNIGAVFGEAALAVGSAGLSSRIVAAKNLATAESTAGIWSTSRIGAVKMEHIFSADHMRNGIMSLGSSKGAILNQARDVLMAADKSGHLRNGLNTVLTKMNGHDTTVRAFFSNGQMQSMNIFKGVSQRVNQYVVDLR